MFNPLQEILPRYFSKARFRSKMNNFLVFDKFNQVLKEFFGQEAGLKCKAMYLKENILIVACLDDDLENKIKEQTTQIIQKINQHFNEEILRGIQFLG